MKFRFFSVFYGEAELCAIDLFLVCSEELCIVVMFLHKPWKACAFRNRRF